MTWLLLALLGCPRSAPPEATAASTCHVAPHPVVEAMMEQLGPEQTVALAFLGGPTGMVVAGCTPEELGDFDPEPQVPAELISVLEEGARDAYRRWVRFDGVAPGFDPTLLAEHEEAGGRTEAGDPGAPLPDWAVQDSLLAEGLALPDWWSLDDLDQPRWIVHHEGTPWEEMLTYASGFALIWDEDTILLHTWSDQYFSPPDRPPP